MAQMAEQEFVKDDGTYEIKRDMIISDVIDAFPRVAGVFMSYGLHCVGCAASAFDTVWDGAKIHGMPDEEIQQMIDDANALINKTIDTVEFTDKAVEMVKQLRAEEEGKEDWPLRVRVENAGGKYAYDMDFDKRQEGDTVVEFSGLKVLVDEKSLPLLKGSIVDYVDSQMGSGFKIDNPNKPCGCGKNEGNCGCGSGCGCG